MSGDQSSSPSVGRLTMCPVCEGTYEASARYCPLDRSALVAIEDPMIGSVLDGIYAIEKLLGRGGMGSVYLGRHHLTERPVAIKLLPKELSTHPERVKRFIIEGKAASRFTHANAVMVHDMRSSSDGILFMVLEYVDGPSLGRMLRSGRRFSAPEAVAILERVAAVLDAAHAVGVIHRDIKPDNIMIGRDGRDSFVVKVGDFGIAKLLEAGENLTRGTPIGTPAYISPEQWGVPARDGRSGVDGRADVYSLAAVAYEMVAGGRAFSGSTTGEYRDKHLSAAAPLLATEISGVTPAFAEAVSRGMAKDRADRPATAGQFVASLSAALSAGPPTAVESRSIVGTILSIEPSADTSVVGSQETTPVDDVPARLTSPMSQAEGELASDTPATREREAKPVPDPRPTVLEAPPGPQPVRTVVADVSSDRSSVRRRSIARKVTVAAVVLIVLGLGAWGIWMALRSEAPASPTPGSASVPAASPRIEAFEVSIVRQLADATWSAPGGVDASIPVGQEFRFRLQAREAGYFYLVTTNGPGVIPMTFLTNRPAPQSGVTTNRVEAGQIFEFPAGDGALRLTAEELRSPYTLVFSRTKLLMPEFLDLPAGRKLTVVEQARFDDFVKASGAASVSGTPRQGQEAPVVVTMPAAGGNAPVVWMFTVTTDVVR